MRVLVTGATGFVGGAAVRELRERGHHVRALVRSRTRATSLTELGVELTLGELGDRTSLDDATRGVDAVLHAAGLTVEPQPGDYPRVNVEGTRALLEACLASGTVKRFVFVSSMAAVGPAPAEGRLDETTPCQPASAYGRSKLDGERLVRALSLDRFEYIIVRPPVVYGPGDRKLAPLYKLATLGFLPGLGDRARRTSLLHVSDLARGLAEALTHPAAANEHFFLAHPDAPTLDDILRTIGFAVGSQVKVVPLPPRAFFGAALLAEGVARLTGRPAPLNTDLLADVFGDSWVCSTEHARERLGFEASVGWREGLRDSAEGYLEQSLLP